MEHFDEVLDSTIKKLLSGQDYEQQFAFYCLWFDIRETYRNVPSHPLMDDIWKTTRDMNLEDSSSWCKLIQPTAPLVARFVSDAESDLTLSRHSPGLQTRLCKRVLQEFFTDNLRDASKSSKGSQSAPRSMRDFYPDTTLIAHWANLGCVEERAIRNHILQSLISHPKLSDCRADALYILFKIAGATFEAYVETSVVDRCFELLKGHRHGENEKLIRELIELRERNWEGLPPPPVFTTGKPKPAHVNQKAPSATPVAISLGLPSRYIETPVVPLLSVGSATTPDTGTVSGSPVSPSMSIATLSDFTIADISDDEALADPKTTTPHKTFYLEDGNAEILCGNTLFRVHTTVLSFHSPTLRQMFAQTALAAAESPNGCPRLSSTDTAGDFAMLLKTVYLPGFPERNKVPDFATFSSLLRITAKYEMPAVRSQLLEIVRDAYPETFDGLSLSKPLGERVFSGPTPHPNSVLNLFVQQKLTSALPMAYYMAARRGLDSLTSSRLPRNAMLPPDVLRSAIRGLMELREVELKEAHSLIFGPEDSRPRHSSACSLDSSPTPATFGTYKEVFNHIVGPSHQGTKVLQVPEFYNRLHGDEHGPVFPNICKACVERWESGHVDLRMKVWPMLPDAFGLKG